MLDIPTKNLFGSVPLSLSSLIDYRIKERKQKKVYIKINQIDQKNINDSNIVAYIGSWKAYKNCKHPNVDIINNKVWKFNYIDKNRSSFVIALFNHISLFEEDKLIGEIEIKLGSFRSNSVTNHTFILRSTERNKEPILINLSIHLSEDGSEPFQAENSEILDYEYEVFRKKEQSSSFEDKLI